MWSGGAFKLVSYLMILCIGERVATYGRVFVAARMYDLCPSKSLVHPCSLVDRLMEDTAEAIAYQEVCWIWCRFIIVPDIDSLLKHENSYSRRRNWMSCWVLSWLQLTRSSSFDRLPISPWHFFGTFFQMIRSLLIDAHFAAGGHSRWVGCARRRCKSALVSSDHRTQNSIHRARHKGSSQIQTILHRMSTGHHTGGRHSESTRRGSNK